MIFRIGPLCELRRLFNLRCRLTGLPFFSKGFSFLMHHMGAGLHRLTHCFAGNCIAILFVFSAATVWGDAPLRDPLPIDVALSLRSHDGRSTFAFSPDGRWISHTINTDDVLSFESRFYSPTGTPLAESRFRREAHLTDTRTGEDVRLGSAASSSWAPTWSPDGTRVAFYSDEGGAAGLWIWDSATLRATRFPALTVRPFFGFEPPRWASDGRTLLCKLLPEGMTVAQANALNPLPQLRRRFPAHDDNAASVLVLRATADETPASGSGMPSFLNRSFADLALLDLRTNHVQRIARGAKVLWYGFSPDQRYVAYTQIAGEVPNSEDIRYDIELLDRRSGRTRSLAQDVPMNYGIELNWSPDSQSLAFINHDRQANASLVLLPLDGSPPRRLNQSPMGSLDEAAPRWSPDSHFLFVTAVGGHFWRVNALSGEAREFAATPGIETAALVAQFDRPTVWMTDHDRNLWAVGFRRDVHQFSLLRIDTVSGRIRSETRLPGGVETGFSIDANDRGNQIAFVTSDQRHPADLWVLSTGDRLARQVSHLNPELERYELGEAKVISFHTADGKELHASLLLPPGYREGQPLPTIVWVYGGQNGSDAVHTFGLRGDTPVFDMHILATRGYAVMFPDAPLNEGTPIKDLLKTVMPAVDAAIAQGYADPDRLAVMGQSYGAYSVLSLISRTDRFKAAVVTATVINPDLLAAYLEMDDNGSPSWIGYFEQGQGGMGGSPWQDRTRYLDNSPVYDFDKIRTPLLMAQGAEDGRLLGSDATFVALRRLGKDVEYRIYEGEGHTLLRRPNVRDFWLRRLAFLKAHLPDHGRQPGAPSR